MSSTSTATPSVSPRSRASLAATSTWTWTCSRYQPDPPASQIIFGRRTSADDGAASWCGTDDSQRRHHLLEGLAGHVVGACRLGLVRREWTGLDVRSACGHGRGSPSG